MIGENGFLEHALVFGNRYGTGRRHVEELVGAGHDVILEIDWQGARQVRDAWPGCITIFILPPSRPELERRLRGRRTDSEEVIARRLRESVDDMSHWSEFDHVVVNDDFDRATDDLAGILEGHPNTARTRGEFVRRFTSELLP